MHKSKLAGFIIDCQTDDLTQAADFWGSALGMPVRELPPDEAVLYKRLDEGVIPGAIVAFVAFVAFCHKLATHLT